MGLPTVMYVVFGLAIVNGVIAGAGVQSFPSRGKGITTQTDLEEFKAMARRQMYQALLQMVLLGAGCVIGLYGIFTGKLGLLLVVALNGLVFVMGTAFKGLERRARSLPVDDPGLQAEYTRVCDSWLHKPTPDF